MGRASNTKRDSKEQREAGTFQVQEKTVYQYNSRLRGHSVDAVLNYNAL